MCLAKDQREGAPIYTWEYRRHWLVWELSPLLTYLWEIIADNCPSPEGGAWVRGQLSSNNSKSCRAYIHTYIHTYMQLVLCACVWIMTTTVCVFMSWAWLVSIASNWMGKVWSHFCRKLLKEWRRLKMITNCNFKKLVKSQWGTDREGNSFRKLLSPQL